MGTKARQVGTRGKALLEKRIGELENARDGLIDELFVLGENYASLDVKLQELIKVNDNQRERLTEASLLRTRINELEEKINIFEQDEA